MDEQLQQLVELQREQNQLLRRYLWRLRFSLLGLLFMTTVIAVGLGFLGYHTLQESTAPAPVPPQMVFPRGGGSSGPAGDIEVDPTIPGTS